MDWCPGRSNPLPFEKKLQESVVEQFPKNQYPATSSTDVAIVILSLEESSGHEPFSSSATGIKLSCSLREKHLSQAKLVLVLLELPHHSCLPNFFSGVSRMLESFSRHHSLELFVKQVQSEKYGSVVATSHALFTLLRVESVLNTNKLHDFPPEKLEAMSVEKSIDKLLAFLFSDSHS